MKKGKVLGKNQIIAVLMVAALGGAVWLNMRFSSNEKYLGEAKYVSNTSGKATQTSTSVKESDEDYFIKAKKEREKTLNEAEEAVKEMLKNDELTDEDKKAATEEAARIAKRIESAGNIETLLKAKGFKKAIAVLGEDHINIVVKAEGLTTAQTMQIEDIVTENTDINLSNIKIITVK